MTMHDNAILYFGIFSLGVLAILLIDLLVIGRHSHVVSFKESLIWTSVWVSLALLFYVFLRYHAEKLHGVTSMEQLIAVASRYAPSLVIPPDDFINALDIYRKNLSMEFITGYLVEYSLSIDNIFVIMMILSAFAVSEKYYKSVLFWGILGAIVLRCIFIFAGSALIQRFEWILLLFGAFLIYSGIKIFLERNKEEKTEPQNHWLVKWLSSHVPVYKRYVTGHFFIRFKGKLYITPLFIVLMMVEFTDLIFAFDSIPAIFAITRDPFIVFFSNIFAIIGLRSLFFLLMRVVTLFHYLKVGVAFLLVFVGIKLLAHNWLEYIGFKTSYSLIIILSILALSILASVLFPKRTEAV
jgi:tellurite resistance protein TerC